MVSYLLRVCLTIILRNAFNIKSVFEKKIYIFDKI